MQRPRAVTILAVLVLVLGVMNLITGILLVTGKVTFDKVFGQVPDLGELQQNFEQTMKVVVILFSLVGIAIAFGLWRLQGWARRTTRVFAVLGLLGALIQMIQAFTIRDPVNFVFYAAVGGAYYWAYYYLGTAPIRAAFTPHPPPSSPAPEPPQASLPPGSDSAG
jgi:hypothetical protein